MQFPFGAQLIFSLFFFVFNHVLMNRINLKRHYVRFKLGMQSIAVVSQLNVPTYLIHATLNIIESFDAKKPQVLTNLSIF